MKSSLLNERAASQRKMAERPLPSAQELDARLEDAFALAAQKARTDALNTGVPVAVAENGRVVWLHPDGKIYPDQAPVRGGPALTSGNAG